ncbi:DarT ssDNA thymidine ADP-ribosyltransferase family protein [Helicovermis profundi]|uniref:DarT domain-containing protein n=1 Tax=Helicovermis profundi TaxID=3065157 RepID=A0AAU9ELC1_9FIRM|nr:hypothetical protein HLPR_11600 [Clostridia bacterium S502]
MAMRDIKNGKLLYHLTKLENLESIIKDGLLPRNELLRRKSLFKDVADSEIIDKRNILGLDKFTPFHFHPYSSFDVAVKSKYENDEFVYICITRKDAKHNDFKIIPIHPLSIDKLILYDYDEGMRAIDWEIMHSYGTENENIKHVKMAECLTDKVIPAKYFLSINVRNENIKNYVQKLLKKYNIVHKPPHVNIQCWLDKKM